jgi:succinyl-diaminopimelate desuccinylase
VHVALAEALAHLDPAELIDLTRELVRIPSVVKPGDARLNEAAVADFVRRWFERERLELEVQEVAPGRPNVIAWLGERGRQTLLLEGHTDVVTEGNPRAWTHPPFGAEMVGGRIYGRGAADMKGGLAAAMLACAALRRSGVALDGCLAVGALVDEEGDMLGAKHLCATPLGRELSAAIICEPEQNEICLEQRGVVWARVTVHGHMAHGAMPEAGRNPIVGVAEVVRQARALERRLRRLCERSRYLRPPTVSPTVVGAPLDGLPQSNVIPATAVATLDIRLTPGPDEAAISAEIDRTCGEAAAACPGLRVEWRPLNGFRLATRVDRRERLVDAVVKAASDVTGRRPRFGGVPGSTDGTILRTQLGIPIVTCGPGNRLIPHQVDEYVETEELVEAARIYVASALNFFRVP